MSRLSLRLSASPVVAARKKATDPASPASPPRSPPRSPPLPAAAAAPYPRSLSGSNGGEDSSRDGGGGMGKKTSSFLRSTFSARRSFRTRASSKDGADELQSPSLDWAGKFTTENPLFGLHPVPKALGKVLEDASAAHGVEMFLGPSVAHLLALRSVDPDDTVASVFAQLRARTGEKESYATHLLKLSADSEEEAVGHVQAVLLLSLGMPWSAFCEALERIDPLVCIWLDALCATSSLTTLACVQKVNLLVLVLPSWKDHDSLWSPEVCEITRVPNASFVALMSSKDERLLARAFLSGRLRTLDFFESLLQPSGNVAQGAADALKQWLTEFVEGGRSQLDAKSIRLLLGHVHCASMDYSEAIRLYNNADADLSVLVEAYRRSGKLAVAKASLELLLGDTVGNPVQHALYNFQLGSVLYDMNNFPAAKTAFEAGLGESRQVKDKDLEAMSLESLAKVNEALGLNDEAIKNADSLLSMRKDEGDDLKTAEAKWLLGRQHLVSKAAPSDRALTLLREASATLSASLGSCNARTLECMHDQARAMIAAGDLLGGVTLFRAVHKSQVQLLGSDHRSTMATMDRLVDALLLLGRKKEATALLESLFLVQQRTLSESNLDVVEATRQKLTKLHTGGGGA